jgi:hypothetical protein
MRKVIRFWNREGKRVESGPDAVGAVELSVDKGMVVGERWFVPAEAPRGGEDRRRRNPNPKTVCPVYRISKAEERKWRKQLGPLAEGWAELCRRAALKRKSRQK